MSSDPLFFVWAPGLRGPAPQIWFDDLTEGGKPVPVLWKRKLEEDERGLSLDELAVKYPLVGGRR